MLWSAVWAGTPGWGEGCFQPCSLGIGGVLLLLPVSKPNPSLALSAMGLMITGPLPSPSPDMTEELFPDLLRVGTPTYVGPLRLSWPESLIPTVVDVAPASESGGMKELS